MITYEWTGCYAANWNTAPLIPEAFSHPAKVAFGLAARIYEHLLIQGYVKSGSIVVDPFAGIGGFAFHALYYGLHFRGVELEQKFYDMAAGYDCPGFTKSDWRRYQRRLERIKPRLCPVCLRTFAFDAVTKKKTRQVPEQQPHRFVGNFELWNGRYKGVLPNWGTAEIYRGDSRALCEVLGGAGCVVGSPPFLGVVQHDGGPAYQQGGALHSNYGSTPGQLGAMAEGDVTAVIGSPPFTSVFPGKSSNNFEKRPDGSSFGAGQSMLVDNYGRSDGQLGAMAEGDVAAVIGSPPYANAINASGEGPGMAGNEIQRNRIYQGSEAEHAAQSRNRGYGSTPGQLGAMAEGDVTAVIGSPPYANSNDHERPLDDTRSKNGRHGIHLPYGDTDGNIGNMPAGEVTAVISSPAYADTIRGNGEGPGARTKADWERHWGRDGKKSSDAGYGETAGQMGGMAVLGSPPYADSGGTPSGGALQAASGGTMSSKAQKEHGLTAEYGKTNGQIGHADDNTFWPAARIIVEQCHQLLPAGGVAVWVTGDFVRKGQRVHFGRQWLALCEAVGFRPLEHIIAWKRELGPVQTGMFEDMDMSIDRVSFFRRLANEKNPDNAILNEDVWIVCKNDVS